MYTDKQLREMPLPLGTQTPFGTIGAVGWTGKERYYWMTNSRGGVSMIPAFLVESILKERCGEHERK